MTIKELHETLYPAINQYYMEEQKMKKFEITFTTNPESGIYSANIVFAESAEQAIAYYAADGYTVAGCRETASNPKPGQPVITVPEGWEAPAREEVTPERYPNIKKSIMSHESVSIEQFSAGIENKTAADLLDSWYYRELMTPKTLEAIKATEPTAKPAADLLEKIKAKHAKQQKKQTAERLEKLAAAEAAAVLRSGSVSVEWVRSRTWGANPHATLSTEHEITTGTASGCGYDKESAAIAQAMNNNPEIMRILYDHAEKDEPFPYSVHTFAGLPSFDGGCGVDCFIAVFAACGYEWRTVGGSKMSAFYTITKKQ